MRIIKMNLCEITTRVVFIGMEGEQDHTQVIFDASPILNDYPDATVALSVKPPIGNIYPVAVAKDGTNVVWNVSAADCANHGDGEYQITFTNGTEIIKTFVGLFRVYISIIGNGTAPTPVQEWLQAAQEALGELEELSASAHDIAYGEEATAEIETVGGHKNISIGVPGGKPGEDGTDGVDGFSPVISVEDITGGHRVTITTKTGTQTVDVLNGTDGAPGADGQDGAPGFSPTVTITDITGGHRVTITDATGAHSFDVMNGEKGDPGTPADPTTLIDDTTTTATNKVWSAKKTAEVESDLKSQIDGKADAIEITDSTSEAVKTIVDGGNGYPIAISVAVEPVQGGSGDPSPSNVRPITGWTGCNISKCGDVLDIFDSAGTTTANTYTTVTIIDKHTINVKTKTNGTYRASKQLLSSYNLTAGKTYRVYARVLSESGTSSYAVMSIQNSENTMQASWFFTRTQTTEGSFTFTYDPTIHNYLSFFCTFDGSGSGNITYTDITLEEVEEHQISWQTEAGTVYGGTLTVNKDGTGKLTVTDANIASYDGETLPGEWISDRDVYESGTTPTTGAQVVYKLAEEVVYDLTVPQIMSLLGTNNVWADTGNVLNLEYVADTKTYVDQSIPTVPVQDVQVNGTSVVNAQGVAEIVTDPVETVTGTTPSITAKPGVRYVCGECATLTIVAPASGIIDVTFESGSTPTVLTVTPPTGVTIKYPAWFNPSSLVANTTYEINIADGKNAVVMAWA